MDKVLHPGPVGVLFVAIFLMNCPESSAVKCDICNEDFVVLGRHRWRCTGPKGRFTSAVPTAPNDDYRINTGQVQPGNINISTTTNPAAPNIPIKNDDMIKCVCGRSCKGRRGLSAHQRCCTAAKSLSDQYQTQASTSDIDHNTNNDHNDSLDGDTTPPVDANPPFVHVMTTFIQKNHLANRTITLSNRVCVCQKVNRIGIWLMHSFIRYLMNTTGINSQQISTT